MNKIFLKRLRCSHENLVFERQVSGDRINFLSPSQGRFIHRCDYCGKVFYLNRQVAGLKLFSVDAETDGLYGRTFCIAVTVRKDGKEAAQFVGRAPYVGTNEFVQGEVLPALKGIEINFDSIEGLEEAFWTFWMVQKDGATVVAHCHSPVETGLFRQCAERDVESRQWDGPYPTVHDVATLLHLLGEEPDSVDAYAAKHGIEVEGESHNPYYDAVITALVWEHAYARLWQ